jgi:50S ribosomal protein L16 3-hydroxylase
MTYSIGFRAPSRAELIEGWCADRADALSPDDRYTDPDLVRQANPGEIAGAAIDRLHELALAALSDRDAFARWFGTDASRPKYSETDWRPEQPIGTAGVRALLAQGATLVRNPASRFCFIRQARPDVLLFVDGQCFACGGETAAFAESLCAGSPLTLDTGITEGVQLVALVEALVDQGSLAFADED